MPRFTVTLVYSVEAESRYLARMKVGEALREGVAGGVTLEFESLTLDPLSWEQPAGPSGDPSRLRQWWKPWAEELRDQLLGPHKVNQQPAGRKKSWS